MAKLLRVTHYQMLEKDEFNKFLTANGKNSNNFTNFALAKHQKEWCSSG